MADSTEQNDAPSIAAPGAESASNDGSSSDLSASTAGTNGADESRNSGAENYSGMSLAAVEVAFKTALIGLLQHQIEFVAMLKEHRVDEERSNVLTNQARGAADNYPFLVASIQVGLLLAYFFTGAGYYFKILFGFALQSKILEVPMRTVGSSGVNERQMRGRTSSISGWSRNVLQSKRVY